MTKSEETFGHSDFGIDSDFWFRISSLFSCLFLIRQVLQILLDLRAVFFRIRFISRLRDRIPIPQRQSLILPIALGIFIRQRRAEAAALDAVAIAGAATGIVRPVALLILPLGLARLPLALLLSLALLTLTLLTLSLLPLTVGHLS